jgi:hypothetical protein
VFFLKGLAVVFEFDTQLEGFSMPRLAKHEAFVAPIPRRHVRVILHGGQRYGEDDYNIMMITVTM